MCKIIAKSKSQLADEYGLTTKGFRLWLNDPYVLQRFKDLHINYNAHVIPPIGVQFIYDHFGIPDTTT